MLEYLLLKMQLELVLRRRKRSDCGLSSETLGTLLSMRQSLRIKENMKFNLLFQILAWNGSDLSTVKLKYCWEMCPLPMFLKISKAIIPSRKEYDSLQIEEPFEELNFL